MHVFRYVVWFWCLLSFLFVGQAFASVRGANLVFDHGVLPADTNAIAYDQRLTAVDEKGGYLWADIIYTQEQLKAIQSNTVKDHCIAENLSCTLESFPKGDNNYVLPCLNRSMLGCVTGNYGLSFRSLLDAKQVMDSMHQKGVTLGKERTKIFKGEPYEQSLASVYMGILLYLKGDYNNARAMFAQALELDRETLPIEEDLEKLSKKCARGNKKMDQGQARELLESLGNDNRLAYYMLARTYVKLGEEQNARISLQNASNWNEVPTLLKKNSCGPYLREVDACDVVPPGENPFVTMDRLKKDNLVVMVQMGFSPKKLSGGIEGQKDYLCPREYPERKAVVYVDGVFLCEAYPMFNLLHQAVSVPRTSKDSAQTGKAVGKFLVTMLVAAVSDDLARSVDNAWSVAGDTRRWGAAPNEIHVASGRVEPGLHTVTVLFFDGQGNLLPHFEQTHYFVPVEEERLLLVRSLRDRWNTLRDFDGSKVKKFNEKKGEIIFYHKDLPGVKEGNVLSIITVNFGDKALEEKFMKMRTTRIRESWDGTFNGFEVKKVGAVKIVKMEKHDATCQLIEGSPDPKQVCFVTNYDLPYDVITEYSNGEILGSK